MCGLCSWVFCPQERKDTRTGKVAVWDIRVKQKKKPETKLTSWSAKLT